MIPTRLKADGALLSVAITWGAAFIAQAVAARNGIAFLFNGASFTLAALVLLPWILKGLRSGKNRKRLLLVSAAAGTILFAATALQQVGLLTTDVANAGFLTSLYAVITPFLLWLVFRERPALLDIAAILFRATISISVGYTVQVWAQKRTAPTDAAIILGTEAAFGAVAAWIILGQSLSPVRILGCIVILSGVFIAQLKHPLARKREGKQASKNYSWATRRHHVSRQKLRQGFDHQGQ